MSTDSTEYFGKLRKNIPSQLATQKIATSVDDDYTTSQKWGNVFNNAWLGLQEAWLATKVGTAEFINFMDPTGGEAMDFMLGERSVAVIIDPITGEKIDFDNEAYKRDGKLAIENQRYYEIVRSGKPYETRYKGSNKSVGEEFDGWIGSRYKDIVGLKTNY